VIDFRYHLVSIVAIFLSLALGLILGASFLQDAALGGLEQQARNAARKAEESRARERQLEAQLGSEGQFAQTLGPRLVSGLLKGESVVLVETPGASQDSLNRVSRLLGEEGAGATVTGRVALQKKFLDDDQLETVSQLADQLKPAGLTLPAGAGPYAKAGAVLADAMMAKEPDDALRDDATGGEILSAFKSAGYVTVSGNPGRHATLAVMIAPSNPYQDGADADNAALLAVADALDAAGRGSVVTGPRPSAAENGLILALRESATEQRVSSVDTVDYPSGQVVTVLALSTDMTGRAGQYGTGEGVSGYLPSPAPTTTPTPGGSG
jgi:copper transport outer membrane protein MctB